MREGHHEILEILLKAGASQPACEEALLEASCHGRARLAELLMSSDLIRPHVAVHALVTACCRGFVDFVDTLIKVKHCFDLQLYGLSTVTIFVKQDLAFNDCSLLLLNISNLLENKN